jgi:hypothetical protein
MMLLAMLNAMSAGWCLHGAMLAARKHDGTFVALFLAVAVLNLIVMFLNAPKDPRP